MNQILSQSELAELTGSKQSSRQKEVLSDHGIGYIVRYDGKISTTWEAIHSALNQSKTAAAMEPDGPNLDFLRAK